MIPGDNAGIALVCDSRGLVLRQLRDELGLAARLPPGGALAEIADDDAREAVERFLAEIRTSRAAFDWRIPVRLDDELVGLHFAGAVVEDGFLMVAARSRNGLAEVNEELLRINNEQTNSLREMAKAAGRSGPGDGNDERLLEELSQVNNELANLQREMVRKNAELSRLNEQKNQLLGMAAHDLRSPLAVIRTYSEFLQAEAAAALDEEQREFVETILDTSRFMVELIDDLLDVAQIESGTLRLDLGPVDLVERVRRTTELSRVLAARKDIGIVLDAPPPPLELEADGRKVEQAVSNLLGNAIKFSRPGTTITVTVARTGGTAQVSVRDQGPGIPEDELPRLFQPFARTSVRATAGEPGTGLGLAIVRRVVEGHGGRISVRSEVSKGTEFILQLPLRRGNSPGSGRREPSG